MLAYCCVPMALNILETPRGLSAVPFAREYTCAELNIRSIRSISSYYCFCSIYFVCY
nr:MAG TPA: hypothetical protein [Caudoviricetes sp.]